MSDDVFVLKHSTGELYNVMATKKMAEVIAAKFELTVSRYVPAERVEKYRKAISLLRECYEYYSHPHFTDRHGMAPRIKAALEALSDE